METLSQRPDIICKLVIIGDTGVGKTCVMRRFTDDEFSYNFVATIGIDFKIRLLQIQGKTVKVQIWDTAGQEKFQSITTSYYRGSKGVIIAYDITNRKSFENVGKWTRNFKRWADIGIDKMLIGNKCDLEESRMVTTREGEKLAEDYGMLFSETSAKENVNVDTVFNELLHKIVAKQVKEMEMKKQEANNNTIKLNDKSKAQMRCICNR